MEPGKSGIDNLRMKIGRAYKHLQEFDRLVASHCSNPHRITKQDDLVGARYVVRCEFFPIDGDVVLSLADTVYALRSGLDQLAWQLAAIGNKVPSLDVMFPIQGHKTAENRKRFSKRVKGIPQDAIDIIRNLQPYNRGNAFRDDPLWQLNELSNIDKHRVPAGRTVDRDFTIHPSGWVRTELDYGVEFSWPIAVKDSVIFEPSMARLVFGDPVHSPNSVPLELTIFDIARIYGYVRDDVMPRFTRFFP